VLQGEIGEVYNIGTQKERTVMDVAHQISKIFKLPEVLWHRERWCSRLIHVTQAIR
jgi:dTDP-D-glucose 4,6-dehydratase